MLAGYLAGAAQPDALAATLLAARYSVARAASARLRVAVRALSPLVLVGAP